MRTALLTLIIISFNCTLQFAQPISFKHLNIEDGLSNNIVNDIIQDSLGFFWFATEDGLNRYDGYEFKVYRHNPSDENSISDNSLWALRQSRNGKIWIGTKDGWLNSFDPVLVQFRKWKIKSDILEGNAITFLYEDSKKNIWIGTYRGGLYRFNQTTEKIDHWFNIPGNNGSLSNNYVSSILEDHKGNIWVSTYNGLNRLKQGSSSNTFERFFSDKNNSNSISDNTVWYLTQSESDSNLIWIGTANGLTSYSLNKKTFKKITIPNKESLQFGTGAGSVIEVFSENEKIIWIDSYAGLVKINLTSGRSERFTSDKNNVNSLSSNQLHRMIKDRSGVIWIATLNGLNFISSKSAKFNIALSDKNYFINTAGLKNKNIKTIFKGSDNRIWLGTDEGLFYSQILNGKMIFKKHQQSHSLNIWSLTSDTSGHLWIGTYGSGLYKLDLATDELKQIFYYDVKNMFRAVQFNKAVYCDNKNNIWIGYWGLGIACYNPASNEYKIWQKNFNATNSLSHDDVWTIYQDRFGTMWIGTDGGGLNLFDEADEGIFYHIDVKNNDAVGLNSKSIYAICESTNGADNENTNQTTLWIGTDNGLNKLVVRNSDTHRNLLRDIVEIKQFTVADGLADNTVKCLIEDSEGNLWLGTSSGISLFDTKKNEFKNFSKADGIAAGDINLSSSFRTDDGIVFMGSTAGLNYFYPEDIKLSSLIPPVFITDFQIFNLSVEPGANSVLKSSIFYTNEIELSHDQNVFSFEFAALDFSSPQSIHYAYKMEGFDQDWVQCGSRRFITYTNLNPGSYTFKVKSTNSDGIWSDKITSVKVVITPPWWQTIWAIILYFLIFVFGIWAIVRFQSNRTRLQQELKLREFEAYHLREVEQMKSRFFANISHEFRTPLMLIKGPLEELLRGRIKDNLKEYYSMLLRNTEKLQRLIDQLLELSQLESESIPLKTECYELVHLVKSFSNSFLPLAEQKSIKLDFNSTIDSAYAMLDKDKFEKIINNLLSNAFKFTDVGGSVRIEISKDIIENKKIAYISICDSGIGIAAENQSKIFDRFFQVDDSTKRNFGGSGIGLALVKELTMLHSWNISVNSKEGEGTEFIITIPLIEEDKHKQYQSTFVDEGKNIGTENYSEIKEVILETNNQNSKPIILFVEDSDEVRKYVLDLMKQDYNVLQAENGSAGFEIAINNMPDLIISDVMMPIMDGFELCKKVKTDWKTSHIPVILLTAKATHQSKLEGLETGADDYLTKPFDFEELSIRIKNLIQQRKLLREKFSKEINANAESITTNPFDKDFVEKIIKNIEKNLQDENFTSEHLAQELYVSRSQLNRKLNAITGKGPGEFIRIYKLKRAAQMILENKLNITQIALEVGFSSPAQFTRAFQKHFNCLPSEFHLTTQS